MNGNKEFVGKLASSLVNENKENNEKFLTGEINLTLTGQELKDRILKLENGKSYLGVLAVEGKILEFQELIKAEIIDRRVIYTIPNWDEFISGVHAFHDVCGPY